MWKKFIIWMLSIVLIVSTALAFLYDLHYRLGWEYIGTLRWIIDNIKQYLPYFEYIKDCIKEIYGLKEALIGGILTGVGVLWAVQSFLYSSLKEYYYGVTLNEIYQRVYYDSLRNSRWVLMIGAPASVFCLLLNFTITSLVIFMIVFMNLLLESGHTVLIVEPVKRRKLYLEAMQRDLILAAKGRLDRRADGLCYKILDSDKKKETDTALLINDYIKGILDLGKTCKYMRPVDYFSEFYYMGRLILLKSFTEEGEAADIVFLEEAMESIACCISDAEGYEGNGAMDARNKSSETCKEDIFCYLSSALGMLAAATVCCNDKNIQNEKPILFLMRILDAFNRSASWKEYGYILETAWAVFMELSCEEDREVGPLYSYLAGQGRLKNSRSYLLCREGGGRDLVLALVTLYADMESFSYEKILLVYREMMMEKEKRMRWQCDTCLGRMGLWEVFI